MILKKVVIRFFAASVVLGVLGAGAAGAGIYFYLVPDLPDTERLQEVRFAVPLRVFSAEGELIAEFGEKRRKPVRFEEIPANLKNAFLAAEDDRFFEHPGVDYQGLLRAAWSLAVTGEKRQGGSTITMQLARNFFLTREKTYVRKLKEILLALKVERELDKGKIFELYLNKIFLGNRAYGVGAAAEIYYGKSLADLSVAESAMIAGLPKAPSALNPVADPEGARERRDYVLGRMHELGFIDAEQYRAALAQPVTAALHERGGPSLEAPFVAEMVRSRLFDRYGESIYVSGMRVYTTIRGDLQRAANAAVRRGLVDYSRRHGYPGPYGHVAAEGREARLDRLGEEPAYGRLEPALVTGIEGDAAALLRADGTSIELDAAALEWAGRYAGGERGEAGSPIAEILRPGDLVRVYDRGEAGWALAQLPEVEGSLVSLDPRNGEILALTGGFDFYRSKFNRVTQARRQPGSGFKPFIYSAALANGFTLATLVNDAPVVFDDPGLEAKWRPENYSGRFFGPTRLHEGLVHSRNLVSIRVLKAIGVDAALEHARRFDLPVDRLPRNLSLALGSGDLTQLELARAYAVFANEGFRIEPHYIRRIESRHGEVIFENEPPEVCRDCEAGAAGSEETGDDGAVVPAMAAEPAVARAERVISPENVYLMRVMLQDVVRRGTGRRAYHALGREDLAGKTGTTNDQRDAWFTGFNGRIVTSARVGFDDYSPLGRAETGSRAALPIWIDYMRVALEGMPEAAMARPAGIVSARIDPETGRLAGPGAEDAIFEYFRAGNVPRAADSGGSGDRPVDEADTAGGGSDYRSLF